MGGMPTGQAACGCPLPLWTLHAVRLWETDGFVSNARIEII
jgi:hypothetical protein